MCEFCWNLFLVVIQADISAPALDADTAFFLDQQTYLGKVSGYLIFMWCPKYQVVFSLQWVFFFKCNRLNIFPHWCSGYFFLSAIDWIFFLIDLLSTSVELESQNGLSKSLCLPACLSLCLPACLSVCLPVYIFLSSLWICEFWTEVLSLKNL